MHDISSASEARELFSKEDFSTDDTRAILLYLIERDERWKANGEKINAAFLALLQVSAVFLEVLPLLLSNPVIFPSGSVPVELNKQLKAANDALSDLGDLIKGDHSVH